MINLDAGGFLFQQNAFYMKMFITVEPWYNELFRFNPGDSKIYGNMKKKLDVTKPRWYGKHILPVVWPFVKSRFHCTDVSRTFWKNLIGKTGFSRMVFLLLHLTCFHPFVTNWSVMEFSCILAHKVFENFQSSGKLIKLNGNKHVPVMSLYTIQRG